MAIFRSSSILVFDGASSDNTTYDNVSENEKVNHYWGAAKKEIFKITNAKLEALFTKARQENKEVALRVRNIVDPAKVKASWIVFDQQKAKNSENYYIFEEKLYDDGGTPLRVLSDGELTNVNCFKMFKKDYVCAIIGSEHIAGVLVYRVFFHPGSYIFEYVQEPVIGPGGAGGGTQIPPQ